MRGKKFVISEGPNPIDIMVGLNVKTLRILKGKTQEWLASKLGISFQQVQRYETGANRIACSKIVEIAKALEQPVVRFFDFDIDDQDTKQLTSITFSQTSKKIIKLVADFSSIKDEEVKNDICRLIERLAASGV